MCGIVYVQRKDNKPAVKQVLKRYTAQKGRGSEGFGYVAVKQSQRVTKVNRFMFEHEIKEALELTKHQHILFHHRYPTSTPNLPEAAHPITVSHSELEYDYIVVHNGVISNDETLKEGHEALGYKYTTQLACQYVTPTGQIYTDGYQWNDSEALAIELARNIEGKTDNVEAKGAIAYIVMQVEKETQRAVALYYGTNGGNPLTVDTAKEFVCIASEGGKAINDNICYRMSLPDNTVTEYLQVQVPSAYQYGKVGYLGQARSVGQSDTRYAQSQSDWDTDEYVGRVPARKDEERGLAELEDAIADVDEEIIAITGDIEFSQQEGDIEEEEGYRVIYEELLHKREKLNGLYVTKANAIASTAKS